MRRAAHLGDDRSGRLMHVLYLEILVIGPLPMEAKYGNAPVVHDVRIDLAVAVLIGDHLAAAREADIGAVIAAIVLLQLFAVAAAGGKPLDAAHESVVGHV